MSNLLPCVEIEPKRPAKAAVLWLHGLGADGHDFEPVVPHLGLPDGTAVRFVFPTAPAIPVTLNAGLVMPAWYDIEQMDLRKRHDEAGIRESARRVGRLLDREVERGIAPERIVLAGFSQGGAIALHVGLREERRLAGLLLLSTYLVLPDTLLSERSEANRSIPIFQAHGAHDPLVPLARGEDAKERLEAAGYTVQWSTWPIQHEVCLEEIEAAGSWLAARLA